MKRTALDILNEKNRQMLTVPSTTTVYEAVQVMAEKRVGAILVQDDDKIVGIWTERDLMYRVQEVGFDPQTEQLSHSMTRNLISAKSTENTFQLYDKFLGRRIRHLLIEEDGEYIGLVSVGDVMRAALQEKADEVKDLNEMVSMEYYENWKVTKQEN
ncbi:MAG: CBS domain-containing protein [Pseudohongiellaceae bacterium]|nr:CBS domain-containing protein [Pseudohongiellaceae bacterium]